MDIYNALSLRRLNDGRLIQRDMEMIFDDESEAEKWALKNHFSGICVIE